MYKDKEKQNKFQRHYQRKQRLLRKEKAIEILGGECKRCGYNENINALQIDHIEPVLRKISERGLTTGTNMYRAIILGTVDLSTLQLLCANCHAIKSYEDRTGYGGYYEE
jgi:hypothetical protein